MMSPHAGNMGGTVRVINYQQPQQQQQQQPSGQQQYQINLQQGMGGGASSPASGMNPSQHAATPLRPGMPQHTTPTPAGPGMLLITPLPFLPVALVTKERTMYR